MPTHIGTTRQARLLDTEVAGIGVDLVRFGPRAYHTEARGVVLATRTASSLAPASPSSSSPILETFRVCMARFHFNYPTDSLNAKRVGDEEGDRQPLRLL